MDLQKDEDFEKSWQENRHIWESTKGLAKAMFYAGQAKAQAVPEGFAVVPIEITPKQIEAYMKGKVFPASMGEHRKFVERLSKDYTAMIEAAQEPAND